MRLLFGPLASVFLLAGCFTTPDRETSEPPVILVSLRSPDNASPIPIFATPGRGPVSEDALGCPGRTSLQSARLRSISEFYGYDITFIDDGFAEAALVHDGPFEIIINASDRGGVAEIEFRTFDGTVEDLDDEGATQLTATSTLGDASVGRRIELNRSDEEFVRLFARSDASDRRPRDQLGMTVTVEDSRGVFHSAYAKDFSGNERSLLFTTLPRGACG